MTGVAGLSFEATVVRLAHLAAAHGGTVVAAEVERDEPLARDRRLTSAAARMLASRSHVVAESALEPDRWFPYARLTFSRMPAGTAAPEGSVSPAIAGAWMRRT